jgi:predicted acylesterase/phospholipase RssA
MAAPRYRATAVAVLALVVVLAACGSPIPREPAAVQAIETGAERYAREQRAFAQRRLSTYLERFESIARGETGDDTFDALLFSGGAEWGAFGAGYVAKWSELGDHALVPMPEFDMLGGISTGALMAAYVTSGEPKRYAALEAFYRSVSPDWIEIRSLPALLSPRTTSLVDNTGVREQVALAVDDDLLADLRAAHVEDRQVLIGTVNLDYGAVRYWNIAEIAAEAADPKRRIIDVLMAATAIAGVFPPVEIDGSLYADLGYVEGIPSFKAEGVEAFGEAWRARHGNLQPPKMRIWLVYNIPLGIQPEAVELRLTSLAVRGYQALVQASFQGPVETALLLEQLSQQHRTPLMEVRWIAIPSTFKKDPDVPAFDPRTANPLADLGRAAAARPDGGWRTRTPTSMFDAEDAGHARDSES